eukprot:14541727-Ditylum_brightwellii.AAC.1
MDFDESIGSIGDEFMFWNFGEGGGYLDIADVDCVLLGQVWKREESSSGCEGATAEVVYDYIVSQCVIAAEETLNVPLSSNGMFHHCYKELLLLL